MQLLLMCCQPALTPSSQICLTLRAVAGLTTEQIAAAFLVPTTTMAQRISRAKATFRTTNGRDSAPTGQLSDRLPAAARVPYLTFNEGYTRSDGADVVDVSLTGEAIRLTRRLRAAAPDQPELAGLLALMLLIDPRTGARTDRRGDLIPLADQDRLRWDRTMINEGVAILEEVLPRGPVGPFQLEAAIAAVHAESATWQHDEALDEYVTAARLTSSTPEQRYLNGKIKRLRDADT